MPPERMKAARLVEYGRPLEIQEVPVPRPRGPEVLVKVVGSGVCHSDVHIWRGELRDIAPAEPPLTLGHEVSGVVEEVGEDVPPTIYPGLPVLVYSFYCEQDDRFARRGLYQLCGLRSGAGIFLHDGGFAEYMLVPHHRYLAPAQGLGDLAAAAVLSDAGLTAMRAVNKARRALEDDEVLLVVGLGGTGFFGLQLARLLTGARIVGVDVNPSKIEAAGRAARLANGDVLVDASRGDARRLVLEATGGEAPKVVIDFVGLPKTLETYLGLLAPTGTYVQVGLGSPMGPPIPIHRLATLEQTITGVLYGSYDELLALIDLARRDLVDYTSPVEKIRLEDVNKALQRLVKGTAPVRQIITFPQD